jgi:acyl-CoA dehydrogenase
MAQQVASANVAARIGMSGTDFDQNRVAVAKIRTSEAAQCVSAQAHALHGAIGITHEFDLHLYTRELQQQRMAYGSESYWAEILGNMYLNQAGNRCIDFVRSSLGEAE